MLRRNNNSEILTDKCQQTSKFLREMVESMYPPFESLFTSGESRLESWTSGVPWQGSAVF